MMVVKSSLRKVSCMLNVGGIDSISIRFHDSDNEALIKSLAAPHHARAYNSLWQKLVQFFNSSNTKIPNSISFLQHNDEQRCGHAGEAAGFGDDVSSFFASCCASTILLEECSRACRMPHGMLERPCHVPPPIG